MNLRRALLIAACLVPGAAAAQFQPPAAPQQQRQHKGGQRIARYLNLTPEQQAHARAELQAVRQSTQPFRGQLKQVRQEMFAAVRANDTARIDRLSAREARLKGRMTALRQEAFARLYSTLSPEQRAKADQMPAHFRQMRQRWMQNRQNPSNG